MTSFIENQGFVLDIDKSYPCSICVVDRALLVVRQYVSRDFYLRKNYFPAAELVSASKGFQFMHCHRSLF